jgi:hypothetical protein
LLHECHTGENFPRPLAAACNARRNSYGVTAILELKICHCSNIGFEQWIFFTLPLPAVPHAVDDRSAARPLSAGIKREFFLYEVKKKT